MGEYAAAARSGPYPVDRHQGLAEPVHGHGAFGQRIASTAVEAGHPPVGLQLLQVDALKDRMGIHRAQNEIGACGRSYRPVLRHAIDERPQHMAIEEPLAAGVEKSDERVLHGQHGVLVELVAGDQPAVGEKDIRCQLRLADDLQLALCRCAADGFGRTVIGGLQIDDAHATASIPEKAGTMARRVSPVGPLTPTQLMATP